MKSFHTNQRFTPCLLLWGCPRVICCIRSRQVNLAARKQLTPIVPPLATRINCCFVMWWRFKELLVGIPLGVNSNYHYYYICTDIKCAGVKDRVIYNASVDPLTLGAHMSHRWDLGWFLIILGHFLFGTFLCPPIMWWIIGLTDTENAQLLMWNNAD